MKHFFVPRRRQILTGSLVLLALAGCGSPSTPSVTASGCPDTALVSTIFLDVTGSSFSGVIGDEYVEVISQVAARTATCSGTINVSTFGESSGQTVTLLRQSFQVDAPTKNARQRKREKLVKVAVNEVSSQLEEAASRTPTAGTDILGLLRLVEETKTHLPDATHEVFVLTDGFTNVDVEPAAVQDLAAAVGLAERITVPDLSGVDLTFSGIGRTTAVVSSPVIEQVTAFWKQICQRTGAASCTVATQWQGR